MEQDKKITINLSDDEIREIEPIVERINGLEELLLIIPEVDKDLREKVSTEMLMLGERKRQWCKTVLPNIQYEINDTTEFKIDFATKTMTIR